MKIEFDLDSLTLGEMMQAERLSGIDAKDLLTHPMYRLALAVFIQRWRNEGKPPTWREVESLNLREALSSN